MEQEINFSESPDVRMIIQLLLSYVDREKLDVEKDLSYNYGKNAYSEEIPDPEITKNKEKVSKKIKGLEGKKKYFEDIKFSVIYGQDKEVKNISNIDELPRDIFNNFVTTEDGTSYFYILTSLKRDNTDDRSFLINMENFFVHLYVRLIRTYDPKTPNIYLLGFQGKIINNMWVVNREPA